MAWCVGCGVEGLGSAVLGFRLLGWEGRDQGSGSGFEVPAADPSGPVELAAAGFSMPDLGIGAKGWGLEVDVSGLGCTVEEKRVEGLGLRGWGSGFRVQE